jgi:hypothetical protein
MWLAPQRQDGNRQGHFAMSEHVELHAASVHSGSLLVAALKQSGLVRKPGRGQRIPKPSQIGRPDRAHKPTLACQRCVVWPRALAGMVTRTDSTPSSGIACQVGRGASRTRRRLDAARAPDRPHAFGSAPAGRALLGFCPGGVLDEVSDGLAGAGAQFQERAQLRACDTGVAD